MIIGIGIDLVQRSRIEKAVRRWDRRFLNRIFTATEQEYSFGHRVPYLHLAGRFAVKEALLKALGVGWSRGVKWNEIGVVNEPAGGGRPRVETTGRVLRLMKEQGVEDVQVTISHDSDYSIAQVLLIGRGKT